MSEWIKVDGIEEVPKGNWLVELEKESAYHTIHSAHISEKKGLSVIAGRFGFDMPKVIAYRKLPKSSKE